MSVSEEFRRLLLHAAERLREEEGRVDAVKVEKLWRRQPAPWPLRHVCADPYCPAKRAEGGWPQPDTDQGG